MVCLLRPRHYKERRRRLLGNPSQKVVKNRWVVHSPGGNHGTDAHSLKILGILDNVKTATLEEAPATVKIQYRAGHERGPVAAIAKGQRRRGSRKMGVRRRVNLPACTRIERQHQWHHRMQGVAGIGVKVS